MNLCIQSIQNEVLNNFEEITIGDTLKISKKPTKKKEFKAVVINLGKPSFQLFINDRFFGTYFYDLKSEKWNVEK
jgi:hypothetical protein